MRLSVSEETSGVDNLIAIVWGFGLEVFCPLLSLQAKCHQYWPEVSTVSFEDLVVTLIDTQELAYYTIRTFRMSRVSLWSNELGEGSY